LNVIIAGAIRNAETFESFRQACCESSRFNYTYVFVV
jgi:hypothetical protein